MTDLNDLLAEASGLSAELAAREDIQHRYLGV